MFYTPPVCPEMFYTPKIGTILWGFRKFKKLGPSRWNRTRKKKLHPLSILAFYRNTEKSVQGIFSLHALMVFCCRINAFRRALLASFCVLTPHPWTVRARKMVLKSSIFYSVNWTSHWDFPMALTSSCASTLAADYFTYASFMERCRLCIAAKGGRFEYKMW